jgi:hypothetical protein
LEFEVDLEELKEETELEEEGLERGLKDGEETMIGLDEEEGTMIRLEGTILVSATINL